MLLPAPAASVAAQLLLESQRAAATAACFGAAREAGIAWPPVPYQRVALTAYSRYPGLRGTVVCIDRLCFSVLPDLPLQYNEHELCELYVQGLGPVLDELAPGWVPAGLWTRYMAPTADRTLNYDLKLANNSWAFECYPKPQLTGDYQFQEIAKPYRRYSPREVVAVRPSQH